jgi:choline dehydrogenase-like flavoprotein
MVPDIEFMFHTVPNHTKLWFPWIRPAYVDGYAIRPTLLHPKSRGQVRLRSTNPSDPVQINYRFFSASADLVNLREGFKAARSVGDQAAMAPFREAEIAPGPNVNSDNEIDNFIRQTAQTAHHPCGTCRMGSDEKAVLTTDLRVRGVDSLRVVDASAMPNLVSAHINACVIMMAEKAAAMILLP